MSRAFIKEDAGDDNLPERSIPSGPNYVTPRGLDLLRKKVQTLQQRPEKSKEDQRELRYWQTRLGSAILVDNSKAPPKDIRFGAVIELRWSGGSRLTRIVGQDEAEEGDDRVSWDSGIARLLIGHAAGDRVSWEEGAIEREFEIVSISYAG